MRRAKEGTFTMAMASVALKELVPKIAMTTMASNVAGKAITASIRRMDTLSNAPPKKPANIPILIPSKAAMATELTPMPREDRAPYKIRENVSRPYSSVPIQCCRDGGARRGPTFIANGSYGVRTGASSAKRRITPSIISPIFPFVLCHSFEKAFSFFQSYVSPHLIPGGCAGLQGR